MNGISREIREILVKLQIPFLLFRLNGSPSNESDFIAFERVSASADYLMDRTKLRPKIAIICGSGLGKSDFSQNESSVSSFFETQNDTCTCTTVHPLPLGHTIMH